MNIQKSLNDSNFRNTSIILKSFQEKYKVIEDRFENSPRHLIHILDDMVQMRAKLEPLVNKTVLLLKQFPSLERDFNAALNETNKYISNLGKIKILCESNCELTGVQNRMLSNRQQITKDEKFYCSTYNEINKKIMVTMTEFQPTFIAELNKIREENLKNIEEKSTQFSIKLKEAAVERFGVTMHDILGLQDNYVHFSNYIQDSKISDELQLIKQNNFHINSKLVDLDKMVTKYRDYCLHCHENHIIRRAAFEIGPIPDVNNLNDKPNTEPPKKVLEKLLHEKILEIEDVIKVQDEENFKSIFKLLDDEKTVENYLAKLQPLKEDVAFKVQREIEILDSLQNEVPKSSIDNVSALTEKTKETLKIIDDALEFIRTSIK